MYDPIYYQKNKERIKQVNLARYHKNKTTTNPVGRPRKKYQLPDTENNISPITNGLPSLSHENGSTRAIHNSV
jgi:hypothetical protein